MADEETFRIADLRRPEVVRGRTPTPDATTSSEGSVGFPGIEAALESSSVDEVVAAMRPRYEILEAMASGGSLKERGSAKKAMAAYEKAADLFEHLFATKEALMNPKDSSAD